MTSNAIFEEQKVLATIELLRQQPELKIAEACRQTRAAYHRVTRRLKGIPASNSRGGHNRKFSVPQNDAIKEHLLFCYYTGRSAGVGELIESANTLLRLNSSLTLLGDYQTVSRRWAERWLRIEDEFVGTIRSKPLSWLRRNANNKEDIAGHFDEYKRCRDRWGILPEDTYNFDETGCQIGISSGGRIIVPAGVRQAFVNDPDNRELVTSVECFSADGYCWKHCLMRILFQMCMMLRVPIRQWLRL